MQKDIRHYDMKEVEFEQDRTDRKFLTLEVSTHLNCTCLKYVFLRFDPDLPPCCIPSFYRKRNYFISERNVKNVFFFSMTFINKILQKIVAANIVPANSVQFLKIHVIHVTSNKQFASVYIN